MNVSVGDEVITSTPSLWAVEKEWNLESALTLIRGLQPKLSTFGYHLTLGGSVLNRGSSAKDLDLYFLPLGSNPSPAPEKLKEFLDSLWGTGKSLSLSQTITEGERGSLPYELASLYNPTVERSRVGGMRVTGYELIKDGQPYLKENVYQFKLKYDYSGLRVDVFILKGEITGPVMEGSVEKPKKKKYGAGHSTGRNSSRPAPGRLDAIFGMDELVTSPSPSPSPLFDDRLMDQLLEVMETQPGFEEVFQVPNPREVVNEALNALLQWDRLMNPLFNVNGRSWRVERASMGSSHPISITRDRR